MPRSPVGFTTNTMTNTPNTIASAQSGDLGYPASVELPGGRILTVFYENLGGESVIMQKIWSFPTP